MNAGALKIPAATRLLPLLWLLVLPAVAEAQYYYTNSYGIWSYTPGTGPVTITGYNGDGGAVTIPGTINGYPVTSIGSNALENTSLTSATIPGSVTNIGDYAFSGCYDLASVSIPDGVTRIGNYAFYDCALTGVTLSNSITSIGGGAFVYCGRLTGVTIPDSVTNIGAPGTDGAFAQCDALAAIAVDAQNQFYSSTNGILFDKSQTTLVTYPDGLNMGGSYTISNSVTGIADAAFEGCSLTNLEIGTNVTSIGDFAFFDCNELGGITIPARATNIGFGVFSACDHLSAITVSTNNGSYISVSGVLFNQTLTTLIAYPGGAAGSYTIPGSVTGIGDYAFAYCYGLTGVAIPAGVAGIGDYAFAYTGLTSVTIPNSVTRIGDYAFSGDSLAGVYFTGNAPGPDLTSFYGDSQATVYYLPGTTGWGAFFDGVPTALWFLPTPLILPSPRGRGDRKKIRLRPLEHRNLP